MFNLFYSYPIILFLYHLHIPLYPHLTISSTFYPIYSTSHLYNAHIIFSIKSIFNQSFYFQFVYTSISWISLSPSLYLSSSLHRILSIDYLFSFLRFSVFFFSYFFFSFIALQSQFWQRMLKMLTKQVLQRTIQRLFIVCLFYSFEFTHCRIAWIDTSSEAEELELRIRDKGCEVRKGEGEVGMRTT